MFSLAKMNNARFLMASSSEIYGNPAIHPQPESYNGSENLSERGVATMRVKGLQNLFALTLKEYLNAI